MTPEQNALLARLDGVDLIQYGEQSWRLNCDEYVEAPDYDDLNNLMPLAWKFKLAIIFAYSTNEWQVRIDTLCASYNDDPKIAIQQALLAIAWEQFK